MPGSDASTEGHTVAGLSGGKSYSFRVRAVNGSGAGPASDPASLTLPGLVVSAAALRIDAGGSETFTVALAAAPAAAVTVAVSSDDADVTVSPTSLTFTPAGYASAETVTVSMAQSPADGRATVTLTASGGAYEGATATVSVSVVSPISFGSATVEGMVYVLNSAVRPRTLPEASGGDGPIVYTVSPALPAGLSFDAATRTVTGTPTALHPAAYYTYTATDSDPVNPDSASLTFWMQVVSGGRPDAPTFVSLSPGPLPDSLVAVWNWSGSSCYIVGPAAGYEIMYKKATVAHFRNATPERPNDAESGSYTVFKDFGRNAIPDTAFIIGVDSGYPYYGEIVVPLDREPYDVRVNVFSDECYEWAFSKVRTATPGADSAPDFGAETVAEQLYTLNSAIPSLTLPEATGGDGTLAYGLSPALPEGLSFDAATRTLTGTPTALHSVTTYTYTATDSDPGAPDSASLTFWIQVVSGERPAAPTFMSLSLGASPNSLEAVWNWSGRSCYIVGPAAGYEIVYKKSTVARFRTATPEEPNDAESGSYTVFEDFGENSIPDTTFTIGVDSGTLYYGETVVPLDPVPYDVQVGVFSDDVCYEWGYSEVLTATPAADSAPDFGTETVADQTYTQNAAIPSLILPEATGGNGTLAYSLSPALPAGLSLDQTSRTLTGTPTSALAATAYSWTAADADGDAASLTFSIAVAADPSSTPGASASMASVQALQSPAAPDLTPTFGASSIADQRYVQDEAIAALTLPEATGGDGTLVYFLDPAAPTGLSLDAASRSLSGTPRVPQAETAYTWTAVDADGDTASLTFRIAVEARSAAARQQAMEFNLAEMARATLAGATEALEERFDSAPGTSELSLAGRKIGGGAEDAQALEDALGLWDDPFDTEGEAVDSSDLLASSVFTLALRDDGAGPGWTVWGRGADTAGVTTSDGTVRTGWLGMDARIGDQLLTGLAFSQSESESEIRIDGDELRIETVLDAFWPYLQVSSENGGSLRLAAGAGRGEAEHRLGDGAAEKADLELLAASADGRMPVAQSGRFTLSLLGDAGLAQIAMRESASSTVGAVDAAAWRMRGGVEAAHDGLALSESGWTLSLTGALALRRDGGDDVSGTGAEISGSARIASPGSRFGIDSSGRWLALRSKDRAREWGASLEATLEPGADGRGASFSIGPEWGTQQDGALARERLFDEDVQDAGQDLSVAGRAGYGFAANGGLLTPFARVELESGENGADRYSTGLEFVAPGGMEIRLEGEHVDASDPDTRVDLDLSLRF